LNPSTTPDLAALNAQEMYVIQDRLASTTSPRERRRLPLHRIEPLSGTLQTDTGCLLLAHS
jgi:hypothetical protein